MTNAVNNDTHNRTDPTNGANQGVGSNDPGFNPDDAVNAAINSQVDMISDLASMSLSMMALNTTIQENGVSNAGSRVEMLRYLLSAQGFSCNPDVYNHLIKGWASYVSQHKDQNNAAGFAKWLQTQGNDPQGKSYYSDLMSGVMNNPSITPADRDAYVQAIAGWSGESNGNYSSFVNKSSVIAQQLNQASTYVQNWQSIADTMKPTQLQQATTEIIAEIGSESSMWTDVVSA